MYSEFRKSYQLKTSSIDFPVTVIRVSQWINMGNLGVCLLLALSQFSFLDTGDRVKTGGPCRRPLNTPLKAVA